MLIEIWILKDFSTDWTDLDKMSMKILKNQTWAGKGDGVHVFVVWSRFVAPILVSFSLGCHSQEPPKTEQIQAQSYTFLFSNIKNVKFSKIRLGTWVKLIIFTK